MAIEKGGGSMKLDTQWLETFFVLAGTGSINRAAVELGMAPSSVKHELDLLEALLTVPLFERSNRGISLTEAGARYMVYAHCALDQLDEGARVCRAMLETTSDDIRLLYAESQVNDDVYAGYLETYKAENPSSHILFERMQPGQAPRKNDILIGAVDPRTEGIVAHELLRIPVTVQLSGMPELVSRASLSPSDLAGLEVIAPNRFLVSCVEPPLIPLLDSMPNVIYETVKDQLWDYGARLLNGRAVRIVFSTTTDPRFATVPLTGYVFRYNLYCREDATQRVRDYIAFMQRAYAHSDLGGV